MQRAEGESVSMVVHLQQTFSLLAPQARVF